MQRQLIPSSPASDSVSETLSCLRYANSAKNIENKPQVNKDADSNLVVQLRAENAQLREKLRAYESGSFPDSASLKAMARSRLAERELQREESEEERTCEQLELKIEEKEREMERLEKENEELKETLREVQQKLNRCEAEMEVKMKKVLSRMKKGKRKESGENGHEDGSDDDDDDEVMMMMVGDDEITEEEMQQVDISF